MDQLQTVCFD